MTGLSGEHSEDMTERANRFLQALPHCRALGMSVRAAGAGEVEIAMPYSDELIGDPETGVIHGGAVSALMDTCGGAAVLCHPSGPASTATLDLRVDYMRPAAPGQTLVAHATCYHVTRTVAFVRATATDDDRERPVATVAAAFAVEFPA